MNEFRKLFKTGFAHVFGSTVINKVIAALHGIILVRILSKIEYAQYTYAHNIFSYANLLCGLGLLNATLQTCSEHIGDEAQQRRFYQFGMRYGTLFNVSVLAGVILLIALFVPLPVEGSNRILAIMCFLPAGTFIVEMQKIHLRMRLENKRYAYLNTIDTTLILLFSLAGALLWKAQGLILLRYIGISIGALLAVKLYHAPVPSIKTVNGEISGAEKHDMMGIAGIAVLNNSLSAIQTLMEVTLIGILIVDKTTVATYQAATTIPFALSFIPSAFITYAYPYFANHIQDKKWVMRYFLKMVGGLSALNLLICLTCMLLAPLLIRFIFGAEYLDAVPAFRILMAGYFFAGSFRSPAGNILVTQRKLKFNFVMSLLTCIIHVLLIIVLIGRLGMIGAAFAHLITMMVSGAISSIYLIFFTCKEQTGQEKPNGE